MSKPSDTLSEGIGNRADMERDNGLPHAPALAANSLFAMAQFRMNELPGSVALPRTNRSPCAGTGSYDAPSRRLQLVAILDEAIRIGDDFLAENDEALLAAGTSTAPVLGSHFERSRQ